MTHAQQRSDHAATLAVALLAAAVVASVVSFDYLPTHDGPQHVYTIHASNHLDDASKGYAHWFDANTPISGHGFGVLFSPLDWLLGWRLALRITLGAITALWVIGAYCLGAALHPARRWIGIALGAAALQWSLYMGFFSFYVGSGFGLFVLAFALARTAPEQPRSGWLAALLFVQALLHLMSAVATGLVVAALLWCRAPRGQRSAALMRIAAVGAPACGVALLTVWVSRSSGLDAHAEATALVAPTWWTLGKCFTGGPLWRAWPLSLLALAAPGVAVLARATPRSAEDRALLLGGGVLFAAAASMPLHLPYWEFFSVRFLPAAICALAVTLPIERLSARRRGGVAALAVGFALASTGWAFAYHSDLAERVREPMAGLDRELDRPGAQLPIVLDLALDQPLDPARAPMPFAVPLANLGKLYAAQYGGFTPRVFAVDPAIHAALLKKTERNYPVPDPQYALELGTPENAGDLSLREAVTVYLAALGTYYDDVLLWGRPADIDHLEWLGFAIEWRDGGLAMARFEGCPLTIRIADAPESVGRETLDLGWAPALGVTHRYPFARARRSETGALVFPLRQSCGKVWLALEIDTLECEGSDANGRLDVGIVRDHPQVECRIRQRVAAAAN